MQRESFTIAISADGEIILTDKEFAGHISDQGDAQQVRASHVVPVNRLKRIAFRVIRAIVDDKSAIAGWTRNWSGEWVVILSPCDGPTLGPFNDRASAIDAEINWLESDLVSNKRALYK